MSTTESLPSLPPPSSSPAASPPPSSLTGGKCLSSRGRGCKIGRGLPLQQRKAYRNLARQTPRVQGLTFDHNQIRWISYWKNEQNKQVQKHFPVSRYGFLGARRLALEERNKIMGKPPGADEAAEAIANLKVDPSIPCFIDYHSPNQSEDLQTGETEEEAITCCWQDEEADSANEINKNEINNNNDNVMDKSPLYIEPSSPGGHEMEVDAENTENKKSRENTETTILLDCASSSKLSQNDRYSSVAALNKQKEEKQQCLLSASSECKGEIDLADETFSLTMTRTTTAAPDSATTINFDDNNTNFLKTDITINNGSEEKEEKEKEEREKSKKQMPPALSSVAIAWEEKFMNCEFSKEVCISLFVVVLRWKQPEKFYLHVLTNIIVNNYFCLLLF